MKIGFTGTREGMNKDQARNLMQFLLSNGEDITEFHHGDCIGSDAGAHELVRALFPPTHVKIVTHPPLSPKFRAGMRGDESRLPLDYLVRDRAIVRETEILLATPKENSEVLRSGTWATIREAIKGRFVVIFLPNGHTMANDRFSESYAGKPLTGRVERIGQLGS